MPQPDSTRNRSRAWSRPEGAWPVDPAAPERRGPRLAGLNPPPRPKSPEKDGRTPDDKDGNEELEREVEEQPSSRRLSTERASLGSQRGRDIDTEDTGEWVVSSSRLMPRSSAAASIAWRAAT
jgi:hypothetical protein